MFDLRWREDFNFRFGFFNVSGNVGDGPGSRLSDGDYRGNNSCSGCNRLDLLNLYGRNCHWGRLFNRSEWILIFTLWVYHFDGGRSITYCTRCGGGGGSRCTLPFAAG